MSGCETVHTGQRFVAEMLRHIDCQAQSIGAYGYGALASPGSSVALVLTALLTIFVALFGLRLIMGTPIEGRDAVGDMLRIAIVLTLATSWPAWRTIGYDLVLKGPVELATAVGGAAQLPGAAGDTTARLQQVDDNIVLLTIYGTGRNTGGTSRSEAIGDSFRGVTLPDDQGLSNGRIWFLAGVIGPLALVKLSAGLLLALAPLMGGLLLFAGTRDLFFGWLRGLGAVALGALAIAIVYSVEIAVLGPWLSDALALRAAQVLTPSAPTELLVMTLSFAVVSFGMLILLAKIAFFGGFGIPRLLVRTSLPLGSRIRGGARNFAVDGSAPPSRAFVVSESVAQMLRYEDRTFDRSRITDRAGRDGPSVPATIPMGRGGSAGEPLGTSFRSSGTRQFRRTSNSGGKRDNRS